MRRSTILFWFALAIALLAVGYLGGRQRAEGPPLDPSSTGPLGTRGLTELVDAFGGSVLKGTPTADTDVTLVLLDRLNESERRELEQWVRNGGLLVVADPSSSLSPSLADFVRSETLDREQCTIPELSDVGALEAESFVRYSVGTRTSCFGRDGLAYVVAEPFGRGRIVSIGGAVALTNQNLGRADNAVLAVNLLVQGDGALAIVYDPGAVAGDRSLADLIPTPVRWLGWQLLVAFIIYVVWRARRFGAVVVEPQLVEIPGSLLVRATGELSRRAGGHQVAGARLRRDLERRLRSDYRVPPDLDVAALTVVVAERSPVDLTTLQRALSGPAPNDGAGLTALVADIDLVSASCLRAKRSPKPSTIAPSSSTADQPLVGSARD